MLGKMVALEAKRADPKKSQQGTRASSLNLTMDSKQQFKKKKNRSIVF
jgi:hypothetical protein